MRDAEQKDGMPGAAAQRGTGERGQSLLEFALLLPLLMLLAVGIVDIGRAVYYTVVVNNAAKAGAEFGSQTSILASTTSQIIATAVCDANGGSPRFGCRTGILTASNVTVTTGCACDTGTGTSCNPMPPAGSCPGITQDCTGQIAECVQVQTTANFNTLFNWPGLPSSFTANGNTVMRVRK